MGLPPAPAAAVKTVGARWPPRQPAGLARPAQGRIRRDVERRSARADQPALRGHPAPELARRAARRGRHGLRLYLPQSRPLPVAVVLGLVLSGDRLAPFRPAAIPPGAR